MEFFTKSSQFSDSSRVVLSFTGTGSGFGVARVVIYPMIRFYSLEVISLSDMAGTGWKALMDWVMMSSTLSSSSGSSSGSSDSVCVSCFYSGSLSSLVSFSVSFSMVVVVEVVEVVT